MANSFDLRYTMRNYQSTLNLWVGKQMAAKDKKEKKAYERAFNIRVSFVNKLEKCNSAEELAVIARSYQTALEKGRLSYSVLTQYHSTEINSLSTKIKTLFAEKQQQFTAVNDTAGISPRATEEQTYGIIEEVREVDYHHAKKIETGEYEDVELDEEEEEEFLFNNTDSTQTRRHGYEGSREHDGDYHDGGYDVDDTYGTNPGKEHYLAKVRECIASMRLKMSYFERMMHEYKNNPDKAKPYEKAYGAAKTVVTAMERLANDYAREHISLAKFKAQTKTALDSKNEHIQTLESHRGWKQILVNLLAAVCGNVVYLAAAAYTGSLLLFKPETDAGAKVRQLKDAVENVSESDDDDYLTLSSSSL